MNLVTILIGAVALIVGVTATMQRAKSPGSLKKLIAMQKRFGLRNGLIIHIVAYSVVPILFGAYCLYLGLSGGSLF